MSNQNNKIPSHLFEGRTKSEIKHAAYCAHQNGTTLEQELTPVKFTDAHYKPRVIPEDDHEYFLQERDKYWSENYDLHKGNLEPIKKKEQITDWGTLLDLMY